MQLANVISITIYQLIACTIANLNCNRTKKLNKRSWLFFVQYFNEKFLKPGVLKLFWLA